MILHKKMASFSADMANKKITGLIHSSDNNLAVIHCKVKKIPGAFAKIETEISLDANWQMMYKNRQLLLDKITVQIGYANDNGEMTYKNSAIIANQPGRANMLPMIWTKDNCQNVYCITYTASASLLLQFSYSAAFKLNEALPAELQNAFTEKQTIQIDPVNASYYSFKISIV